MREILQAHHTTAKYSRVKHVLEACFMLEEPELRSLGEHFHTAARGNVKFLSPILMEWDFNFWTLNLLFFVTLQTENLYIKISNKLT